MNNDNNQIELLDLFTILLKQKTTIIFITFLGIVVALGISISSLIMPADKFFMPNVYSPKAIMLINDSSSAGGSLSSLLSSSGMGGLANLAGINIKESSKYSSLAVYLIETNDFLDAIVDKYDLVKRYKIKKNIRTESRIKLKKKLKAEFDEKSSVYTITFTDRDPVFAQAVVNFAVANMDKRFTEMGLDKNKLSKDNLEINLKNSYEEIVRLQQESQQMMGLVNSGRILPNGSSVMLETSRIAMELSAQQAVYTQLKTQYELVKVQLASETPVFQVLEYAEVPDKKSGPSRGMLCIIMAFSSLFFSIFLAYLFNAIEMIRKDETAMEKISAVLK